MAGGMAIRERFEALAEAQGNLLARPRARGFALVTAQASLAAPGEPSAVWDQTFTAAATLRARAKWHSHLRGPVRFPISGLLTGHGLDADVFMDRREAGQAVLRQHGIHCRDHEEGTLMLLQVALCGVPSEALEPLVDRFQSVYRIMKEHHWLTVDTRFYPALAYTVVRETSTARVLTRFTAVSEELKRRRLRARRAQFLAALILADREEDPAGIAESLVVFDREARGAGLRTRHFGLTDLALLLRTGVPIADLVAAWRVHMRALRAGPAALSREEATRNAAALLLHEHTDNARRCPLTATKAIADILRIVFAIRHERSTSDSGDSWGHGDDWPGGGD